MVGAAGFTPSNEKPLKIHRSCPHSCPQHTRDFERAALGKNTGRASQKLQKIWHFLKVERAARKFIFVWHMHHPKPAPTPNGRDLELQAMPTIAEQLPLMFETTGFCWTNLVGTCNGCGCKIGPAFIRGLIRRSIPSVACVEAIGTCPQCKKLTRYFFRIYDDKRLIEQFQGTWRTHLVRAHPIFWRRLLAGLFRARF